ncbi:MAG: histidine phosphatase family protein [Chitinophagales bacterium]|nr:histidine phosphatase family protein [Chitinophagales bacterium]
MKTLLLIRHAKSDWNDASLSDFDRPLNERGKRDAPLMAQRLLDKKISIDLFVSSPAKRAKKTASIFAEAYGLDKKQVEFYDELYLAPETIFTSVISRLNNNADTVAVFAHNPGITGFANSLTNTRIDDMPTCCIFAVQADCKDWSEFAAAKKKFLFADYPKA